MRWSALGRRDIVRPPQLICASRVTMTGRAVAILRTWAFSMVGQVVSRLGRYQPRCGTWSRSRQLPQPTLYKGTTIWRERTSVRLSRTQRMAMIGSTQGRAVTAARARTMATVVRHALTLARWRCLLVTHFQSTQ